MDRTILLLLSLIVVMSIMSIAITYKIFCRLSIMFNQVMENSYEYED